MAKDSFLKYYNGRGVEDDITVMSKEALSFGRKFKNYLRRNLSTDCEIMNYSIGHYYISGFIRKDNKYVYFSYYIPRGNRPIDVTDDCWYAGHSAVLYRMAENNHDYHGDWNRYTSLENLPNDIIKLLF